MISVWVFFIVTFWARDRVREKHTREKTARRAPNVKRLDVEVRRNVSMSVR